MKRFSQPVKLPTSYINTRVLRDHFKRQQAAENEVTSRALKFIARNTALPARVRLEAQLQLTSMPHYTRMTQTQFRKQALEGDLPGVMKGIW